VSRYEYIDSCRTDPSELNPVTKMCAWLAVSTSGFYHWLSRPQSATAARREALTARVKGFIAASDGTYGYRRIHADLAEEGTECSPELVRQIMRTQGLIACQPRPFRVTTEADAEAAATMPDLVERDFTADRPGVKFVGDFKCRRRHFRSVTHSSLGRGRWNLRLTRSSAVTTPRSRLTLAGPGSP
jgi:putative transposase